MNTWIMIFSCMGSLTGLSAAVFFAISFWRLNLFAPTTATRTGVVASVCELVVWFVYGMVWVIGMVPLGSLQTVLMQVYDVPYLWQTLWSISTVALTASILCLAWTLHHGIRRPDHPGDPSTTENRQE